IPEPLRDLGDDLGSGDRGGVDAHLVRTGAQQAIDVLDRSHAASDGERDEDLLGGAADDVVRGRAVAAGGGDVQEGEFVGTLGVVDTRHLDRITSIAQVDEVHALDDSTTVDVQAGDHTDG